MQSPPRPVPAWLRFIDQGANDPRLKGYRTPEGIKVEIVADFPTVINPVGMTFGDDGTLYVLEWRPDSWGNHWHDVLETFHYKDGTTRQVATMKKRVKDVVKILRRRDTEKRRHGDTGTAGSPCPSVAASNVFDQAEVILEDELPSSILMHDGWLYLSSRGTVRRYKQSKLGGPYDIREVIAQGFCGFHHHQVSGMTIGNDGWLYITAGDDDNYVEGSDGSRSTLLRCGGVFRCRPDGSRMHVFSRGYRNPYRDVAFDTAFNIFHADNDNEDGSKFTGCRLMHVAEESDFGWRLRAGARCCVPDHVRAAAFGELPGKLPPLLKTGRGAPAGLLIYNDSRLPSNYHGLIYYPDVFRKLIRAYKVEPRGSTFAVVEEFEFMKSHDPLFRPCQMVLGPDGAMYICDWRTDSGGAGRLWGDGKHGRIYRVSWTGTVDQPALPLRALDSWAKIKKMPDDELFTALSDAEFSDRQRAQREIVRRGEKHRPALIQLVLDGKQSLPARIEALGALESFWNDKVCDVFCRLLHAKERDLRRLAAEGLSSEVRAGSVSDGWGKPSLTLPAWTSATAHAALLEVLGDPEPAVRRAVALALGRIAAPGTADILVNTYKFEDGHDVYLKDGLIRAIERLGKPGIDKLLALAESGGDRERDKAVEAFLSLRTRPAVNALPRLLRNPHLSVGQRADLLRSFSNYLLDPPISFEPIVDYLAGLLKEPAPVKLAGLEALSLAGAISGEKAEKLLSAFLEDQDPGVRLSVIKAVADSRMTRIAPRLVPILADRGQPAAERLEAVKGLRVLQEKAALPVLKEIVDSSNESAEMRLEALRSLAALDAIAAQNVSREFLAQKDANLQKEAVRILGTEAGGARLAAQWFLAKKLPRELLPQVSDALQKHAAKDPALADMLTEVMKSGLLLSVNPEEIARVRKLVRAKGDPTRGKALFLNTKLLACLTCHRMEGAGGNAGPDLTRLWDTSSIEKILESIIEPSKEIKEGYQAYQVSTKNGRVLRGLKVSQTAEEIVLRDAEAKDIHIAAKDLEEMVASKQSLMPVNVVSQLTFDQFIDLIAFLKDRRAQESLRGIALDFWVVGPFDGDLKKPGPPEEKSEPGAVYSGPHGEKLAWQARQAEPSGLLNLGALFAKENTSAYVLTYVYSPRAQKVNMQVGSEDMLRIWLNGRLVHEQAAIRSARTDEDEVVISLKAGWNLFLAKVVKVNRDHGLLVRFAGSEGVRVALKPEGK